MDRCGSVQQTRDGGYVVAGTTRSPDGDGDAWVIKIDAAGRQAWAHTFGGDRWDYGLFVQQTTDGGYIVAGQTRSFADPNGDAWVIKLDVSGEEVWSRTFGGQEPDEAACVRETRDKGYIVAGATYASSFSDGLLVKLDASGAQVWSRTFGDDNPDGFTEVQQTRDGGYIVAGYTVDAEGEKAWLVRTNAAGETLWARTYSGAGYAFADSVDLTRDGGFIVAGHTTSPSTYEAVGWLLKVDAAGDEVWSRTLSGTLASSVQQTRDGSYLAAGYVKSPVTGADAWLIKVNASGDEAWSRTFGGAADDSFESVQETRDGGYIVAGQTASFGAGDWDIGLIKNDALRQVPAQP